MDHPSTEKIHKLFLSHPVISTDSRLVPEGCLFFALKGDHFNGNAFAEKSLDAGAAFAIVDENEFAKDERFILVDNVLKTLQELAHYHRKQFHIPVLAITGTNGKTTTKELVHAVLSTNYNILATSGNLNNHIGVPLTLLKITKDTKIAIIEMGANHPGEIDLLCRIADPDLGMITNIGKAHLEGFGGFQGVINTKTELYRYLKTKNGKVFLNTDHPALVEHAAGLETITYGTIHDAYVRGSEIIADPFLKIKITIGEQNFSVQSKLFGRHNAENILAAACIGDFFTVFDNNIKSAIETYTPDNNRSQVKKTEKNLLILDAYNANPGSMVLAIRNFATLPGDNKTVILGDMLELGNESEEEHRNILEILKETGISSVYLVGPEFLKVNKKREWYCFEDADLALLWFEHHELKNSTILVKGSRGIGLEKISSIL